MMPSVVIFAVLLILLVVAHFLLQRIGSESSMTCVYNVVRAGSVCGEVRPVAKMSSIANLRFESEGKSVNAYEYVPYVVDGESMSKNGIHTDDIVLTKDLQGEERMSLKQGDVLLLTYNINDGNCSVGYKLRQFISYIRLTEDLNIEEWCSQHGILEPICFKEKFVNALQKKDSDAELYLCSKTWHDGSIDYSFHPMSKLKGKVWYCISSRDLQ